MPSARPTTVVFAVAGPIARADLPAICGHIAALLEATGADVALCDVGALPADAVAIDALARINLAARRMGRQVVLRHAGDDLRDLVAFVGLAGALRIEPGGRPNSGNSVSVSRKNVNSTIRPPEISSTWSAHGS